MYLWRAVDEGEVLDMLVQRQQDISRPSVRREAGKE
jgi:transposase-like protein